jgi:hypothetical protein
VFSISLLLMSARVHAYVVRTSGRTKFACIQGRNLVAAKRLAMLKGKVRMRAESGEQRAVSEERRAENSI